ARWFADVRGGNFTSPANDLGTLTQNQIDSTYTYTARDQTESRFGADGYLTSIRNPRGEERDFTYSSGLLTGITSPDGSHATLTYDGNSKLQTIQAPGNRTVTITVDGT